MKRLSLVMLAAVGLCAPLTGAAQSPAMRAGTIAVPVEVTVVNSLGHLVTTLTQDEFEVFDNGKRQVLTTFKHEVQPITVVVMIDSSGSLVWDAASVQNAAEQFITKGLLPGDRARVGSFSDHIEIKPPEFTSDRAELIQLLHDHPQNAGAAPLWNAASAAMDALAHQPGRRVALIFTYGKDQPDKTAVNTTLAQIRTRAQAEDIVFYAMGLAGKIHGGPSPILFQRGRGGATGRGAATSPVSPNAVATPDPGLKPLTGDSGGEYFEFEPGNGFESTFAHVADALHDAYVLGFTASSMDGKIHKLEVRVREPGLIVHARKSYLAAPNDAGK